VSLGTFSEFDLLENVPVKEFGKLITQIWKNFLGLLFSCGISYWSVNILSYFFIHFHAIYLLF